MSDTPTCPLSDEELGSMAWKIFGSWNCDPYAIALAVVAAERKRLRAWFQKHRDRDDEYNYDSLACFDAAVAAVDTSTE